VNIRGLLPADLDVAGAIAFQAYGRTAVHGDTLVPWLDESRAAAALAAARHRQDQLVVAEEGGAVVGVGAVRLRGEVASLGPIATYVEGRGIGGALLDALVGRADEAGARSHRVYVPGGNPAAYALCAGRGFAVTDVVVGIARDARAALPPGNRRGLEVRRFQSGDLDELARLDERLTGHERRSDLAESVALVARRRSAMVGYLAMTRTGDSMQLGPAVAVDTSDLFTLVAHVLGDGPDEPDGPELDDAVAAAAAGNGGTAYARLSTAPPAASIAALALGFQIRGMGVVMSRGGPPPARPAQLYGITPEVL